MSQRQDPKFHVVTGVPMTVEFRTTPATWRVQEAKRLSFVEGGVSKHPRRYFERLGDWLDETHYDAWSVREKFIGIDTEEQLMVFLNSTGVFARKLLFASHDSKGLWGYEDFKCWQNLLRGLLQEKPQQWTGWLRQVRYPRRSDKRLFMHALTEETQFKIRFGEVGPQHVAVVQADDSLSAMLATIYIDHLRGAEYKFCAREDCRKAFELVSKHDRKYCSHNCAHLMTVRRYRMKEASQLSRGHKK